MRRIRAILVILLLGTSAGVSFRAASVSGGGSRVPLAATGGGAGENVRAPLKETAKDVSPNERRADDLVKQGKGEEAISVYEGVIAAEPENVTAPYALAEVLAAKGRSVEAQKVLEKSLKLHPKDAATNEALADMVVKSLGEIAYPTVKPLYETAIGADPGRARAALGLAKIERAAGQLDAAGAVLEGALKFNPRDAALHLELAGVLAQQGKLDDAGKHFDIATAMEPANAEAWAAWGQMLLDSDDGVLAEVKFRKAVDLEPRQPKYHVYLGQALRKNVHATKAVEEFATAMVLDQKYAPAYYEMALACLQIPDEARAELNFRGAIALKRDYTLAKLMLARLLVSTEDPRRKNPIEAMDLLGQAAAETHEEDISVLVAYADALGRVANTNRELHDEFCERAIEQLDKAIAQANKVNLRADLMEQLQQYRYYYLVAMVPAVDGNGSPLSVGGMTVHDAMDDPLPPLNQAPVGSLLSLPVDLSKVPQPGDVLDQATQPPDGAESLDVPTLLQGLKR